MKAYDHKKIEKKWQTYWAKKGIYKSKENAKKPKQYVLDMFPYPSGEGLHVGHPKGYIATDVYSRMSRMRGFEVLHPMGWDAFGLPAENYAIKNKIHPRKAVEKNIKRFKEQLKMIGLDYDWNREINTTDPNFYKWTQWIFLKLYEKGLAYESNEPINWCPTCQTGLSNEDLEGNTCERCGTIVEKRPMRQWILKITDYADRMLEDLKLLPEWQEHIKESQRNWIGKSEGAEIDFPLTDSIKRVILLHGKGGTADGAFKPSLKAKLESFGYQVYSPQLPNASEPNDEEQANFLKENFVLDEETAVLGHSFGGIVALRLLERGVKLGRLTLLATPYNPVFKDGKERPSVANALKKGFDWEKIRANCKGFLALYDETDDVVPVTDGQVYAKQLRAYLMTVEAEVPHFNGQTETSVLGAVIPAIRVFTTRPDTLYGATFLILSPEHPWVTLAIRDDHKGVLKNQKAISDYVKKASEKTEIERQENKEKTGVRLEGVDAINPATGEKIPMYVADYVLAGYGTGAIMAVPAHDDRDYDFAKKFDLPIKQVVAPVTKVTSGGDAVRADAEWKPRDAVMGIIKHWEKDEYLCISWKAVDMRSFPSGGIEEGEKPEETVVREIREETGYQNVEIERQLGGFSYIEFYHQIKKTNVRARFRYFLGKLRDGEHHDIAAEESAQHEVVWKRADELPSFLMIKEKERILHAMKLDEHAMHTDEGILVNSGPFDGIRSEEAREEITEQFGRKKTTYKIRDWVFSRQRYWGEPIPVIHCPEHGVVPVPEKDLPVKLPEVKNYKPTGTGESPLADIKKWVNTKCPICKKPAKRETNTMPQWAGSSWYYLRYMDPKNKKVLVDAKKEKYWAPVDLYVGGAEHATRHLIYARFWHKFLFDQGFVSTQEPFTRLISVGLIQAEDGRKMSKRFGNVINPDDIVKTYGADTLRVYEMFMGPFTDAIAWNTNSMIGARRFLERVWRLQEKIREEEAETVEKQLHRTIKKVGEDIQSFKFNTAISAMMIFLNAAEKEGISKRQYKVFMQLLAPFAPHMSEDIWQSLGNKKSIHISQWPAFEKKYLEDETVTFVIQINGKVRGQLQMSATAAEQEVQAAAEPIVKEWLKQRVLKVVFVPKRLINFVVAQ